MDNTLEEKPLVQESSHKPEQSGFLDRTISKIKRSLASGTQHESWWSNLIFWIGEIRWRRAFWKKISQPHESEIKK
jgi:hypothetical protein